MIRHNWYSATLEDVPSILNLAEQYFQQEPDLVVYDPATYAKNLSLAIVNQFYNPLSVFVATSRDEANHLLAYTWVVRGEKAPWNNEEIALVRMAHLDLTLSPRQRVALTKDMLQLWEGWAQHCGASWISSSSTRKDQDTFMRLHEKMGYAVRGSFAYKRLSTT